MAFDLLQNASTGTTNNKHQTPQHLKIIFFSGKGTVSLAWIWCFLPFSAAIVRALQERSYEKNRGNYLTYESSLQSHDIHVFNLQVAEIYWAYVKGR